MTKRGLVGAKTHDSDVVTYFELLANLFPDGLLELLEAIGQIALGLIVVKIFVTELIQNGILDVFILRKRNGRE